jgi:hypothetical protein
MQELMQSPRASGRGGVTSGFNSFKLKKRVSTINKNCMQLAVRRKTARLVCDSSKGNYYSRYGFHPTESDRTASQYVGGWKHRSTFLRLLSRRPSRVYRPIS